MNYQIFNHLFRYSKDYTHKKIRAQGLSDTECMICSYLYSHENCSQEDVSAALKSDKTTVGKALASLERKQCVLRTQDPDDRRFNQLRLTDFGREKITGLLDLHDDWLASVMSCLTEEEQRQFENYCCRLLAAAGKMETP